MNSKSIDIVLISIVLLMILFYFGFRNYEEKTVGFISQIEQTESYIEKKEWNQAIESSQKAKFKWEQVRFFININYGEADMLTIEEYMNLLIGGTKTKSTTTSLSSTSHIKYLWNNMHKFVPHP